MTEAKKIVPLMLGTAGHVDHGKTSLVRQLAHWETDTHKEEQERGMSIDFGVAPFALDDSSIVGIIDVPGHVDFIRNMVAGASAVDVLLLVVAADDGVMPQTREHMQIAALLGVSRVISVITKCDLVDEETKELAAEDVRDMLRGFGITEAGQYFVSNISGAGIEQLREGIKALIADTKPRDLEKAFRMYVRKAFTMKGFGTVVTGVPLSGSLQDGQPLELLPDKREVRIRAMQNYRSLVTNIQAHVSCALNLRDMEPEDFERGMALTFPGAYCGRKIFLVSFDNQSKQHIRAGKSAMVVRLHVGTAAVPVRVAGELKPGQRGFLLLHAAKPLPIAIGDRVILRTLSTSTTLGGGRVLRSQDELNLRLIRSEFNEVALEAVTKEDYLSTLLWTLSRPILTFEEAVLAMQIAPDKVGTEIKRRVKAQELLEVGEQRWVIVPRLAELQAEILNLLRQYHRAHVDTLGMRDTHLSESLRLPRNSFERLWSSLKSTQSIRYENGFVSLAEFAPSVSKQEREIEARLLSMLEAAGNDTVAKGTVLETLSLNEKDYKKIVKRLSDSHVLAVVGGGLISKSGIDALESTAIALFVDKPLLELKDFRDRTGLGRNAAVEVLEYFDARGLTKRSGNGRILNQKK
jgi:selenocysteine-specific elongation factor